jgi:heme/copper-type cytochrome/quinol oxidase subunit 4
MLNQPAGIAIGFGVIGVWCLLKRRYETAGVICFIISLACKPQIAGLLLIYFLLAKPHYRRRAIQIAIPVVLINLAGILWVSQIPGSAHWAGDLHANLDFMVARGNPADPGPGDKEAMQFLNLQSAVSVFRDDPRFYNPVVWAITGVALLAWFYQVIRVKPSLEKDLIAIAAAVCLTLLPVYHRAHDVYLLQLSLPAAALLFARRRLMGTIAFLLLLLPITFISPTYTHFFAIHYVDRAVTLSTPATLVFARNVPVAIFALGLLYLLQFFRLRGIEELDPKATRAFVAS